MATETPIEKKIRQFKAEVCDRELTTEQAKIYAAFTKTNGKTINVHVTDCEGVNLKIALDSSTEVKKILLKHYKTSDGTVTALQILNMFDLVRKGKKYFSQGNYVYSVKKVKNSVTYKTVIKIYSNGKDAVLKSFHSTIGYK